LFALIKDGLLDDCVVVYTYVLLDDCLRFSPTGKTFLVDMMSKVLLRLLSVSCTGHGVKGTVETVGPSLHRE
jgi:hypothetical protein